MKIKYIIFLVSFFALFYSCREGYEYKDLTPDEKQAFLFYIPENFKFSMIKNNIDTNSYLVSLKTIKYEEWDKAISLQSQNLFIEFSDTNNNKIGKIFYCSDKSNGQYLDFDNLGVSEIVDKKLTVFIQNKYYYDAFLLKGTYNSDSAYTNKEYGLIKIWNDTLKYERLAE